MVGILSRFLLGFSLFQGLLLLVLGSVCCFSIDMTHRPIHERPPKPPTIRNSFTRTLVLDTIMKLSGTIGVTQKTMTFDTHVCQIFEFEDIHPASWYRHEMTPPKTFKSCGPKIKDIMHKMNTPQRLESERQLRTMTKTMTERWPFS